MKHHSIKYRNVPRETFLRVNELAQKHQHKLEKYLDQLLWWNERVNLVSRNVSRETIWQHIRHSLLLSLFEDFQKVQNIVDAGTGGGLPGMALAVTQPSKNIVLNDIVSKKCLAIKQMKKTLDIGNVTISDGSIQQIDMDEPFLLISKHAFRINELYKMTKELPWKKIIFYKGNDFKDELEGINNEISIAVHDLSTGGPFYKDKALIIIERE